VCAAVLYCPAVNSELLSVNFVQGLNEEIDMLIYLIWGDFDCRKQERQMELLHFLDAWKYWTAVGYNIAEKNSSKDKSCNAEGKNLIDVCEVYLFRILNGKFRFDTRGKFTVFIKFGSSVIDCY
jgi:hypothetical protein